MASVQVTALAGEWLRAARATAEIATRRSAGPDWQRAVRLVVDAAGRTQLRVGWIDPYLVATLAATPITEGEAVLDARPLVTALRALPATAQVTLTATSSTDVALTAGDGPVTILRTTVAEPDSVGRPGPLAAEPTILAHAGRAALVDAIAAARRSVDQTGAPPLLTGIAVTLGPDQLELAGTDRHRLTVVRVPADVAPAATGERFVLPAAMLGKVAAHFADARVSLGRVAGAHHTAVSLGDHAVRLDQYSIGPDYVPYQSLLGTPRGATVSLPAEQLAGLAGAVCDAVGGRPLPVHLAVHRRQLVASVPDDDYATTWTHVTTPTDSSEGDFYVAVDPRYLADLAATFAGHRVELALSAADPRRGTVEARVPDGDVWAPRMLLMPIAAYTERRPPAPPTGDRPGQPQPGTVTPLRPARAARHRAI